MYHKTFKVLMAAVVAVSLLASCSNAEDQLASGDSTISVVIPSSLDIAAQNFVIDLGDKETWKLGIKVRNDSLNNKTVSVGVDQVSLPTQGVVQTGNYDRVCGNCNGVVVVNLAAGQYSIFVEGQPTKAKITVNRNKTADTAR